MSVSAQGPGLGRRFGRLCAGGAMMAGLVALGACSADTSRFDYPVFNLSQSQSQSQAPSQQITTAALPPVPAEPIYGGEASGRQARGGQGRADAVERRPMAPLQGRDDGDRNAEREGWRPTPSTAPAPRPIAAAPPLPAPVPGPARASNTDGADRPSTVTVADGDTLFGIAREYGVSTAALKQANELSSDRVRTGQTLRIPGGNTASATHKVRPGETVYAIARSYNVDPRELSRRNELRDAVIRPGQMLAIPDNGGAQVAEARPTQPATAGVRVVRTRAVQAPREQAEAKPVRIASTGPVPVPQASPARGDDGAPTANQAPPQAPTRMAALPQPKTLSTTAFRWPVRGRVVSGFGAKSDGRHNDGINISVPQGTEVKAANDGVVAYAGNELEGYGNLVLIRHGKEWVSAYAHNDALLVKRGDTVKRGQAIARAGQSGAVNQPQLHFELRKGSKPVDPVQHLAQN